MKVWAIMGNDYPDAVFDAEEAAHKYIDKKKKQQAGYSAVVYWRAYEFEVQS